MASSEVATVRSRVGGIVDALRPRQRALWILAVSLYGVGDTATTALGLATERAVEAGPIAAGLVGTHGIASLVGLKVVVFGGFATAWWVVRTPSRVAIPLALVVAGAGVTGWNLAMIALG